MDISYNSSVISGSGGNFDNYPFPCIYARIGINNRNFYYKEFSIWPPQQEIANEIAAIVWNRESTFLRLSRVAP